MRNVKLEILGESIDMPISFEAGEALAAAGYDPFLMALRSRNTSARDYPLASVAIITVLAIGAKFGKSKLTRPQIGQAVYDLGVNKFVGTAVDYLGAFVEAEPEHPIPDTGKKAEPA